MSKKSRKKSSKSASSGKARAKTAAEAGTNLRQTLKPAARKSATKASNGLSHKAASKPLKAAKAKTAPKPAAKTESPAGNSRVLAEGAKAPAFRLPRDGGEVVSLSDFAGKKLVLFFYPRANTPGCTKEAMDFTRLSGAFADSGTAVLGVSADSQKAQESFRDKHKLDVPLISDEKHEMLEAYGAWGEKSLYGRIFLGIIRTTVLIGADGLVKRIWRHVKVDGHAEAVLEAARSI
ncbi:peroxiredoxin [Bradyrhizobium sp. Tv2a-2]|uniref:peroxiredoxin n=1 Tax=Bradyrhizobium sp. Tv2a-2 TaxID=113395 RepID=UPI000403636E|nr:peroxiredoxin [Bradyrhizobium sp. Tv2a-2]